jgi:hypothetical protein
MKRDKSILAETWDYLKVRKRWWLLPIVIMLVLFGILIIFGTTTNVPVFIYPLI